MRGGTQSLGGLPFTISGNRSWTGFQTFNAAMVVNGISGTGATLQLKAVAGQTGHLLELYNVSGDLVLFYAQDGTLNSNAPQNYTGGSAFTQASSTAVGLIAKRFSSGSTGNLQEWQDENGVALLKVTASGGIQSASGGLSVNSLGVGITTPSAPVQVNITTPATSNYGTISVGTGAWDGTTTGHFAGSSRGTLLAGNAVSGFSGDLVNFQTAGTSLFKVDGGGSLTTAGNATIGAITTLTNSNGRIDFTSTSTSVPQAIGSLAGFKIRLYGSSNGNSDFGIGVAPSNLWLNAGVSSVISFYVLGTRVGLFQTPGTTERSASANLSLPRDAATQAQGISFSQGVAYDAAILRSPNDDTLRFGFDSGGAFTERLLLNANGLLTIDPTNSNNGLGGAGLIFGTSSGEQIYSKRTAGGNQNGLDFVTNSASQLAISNSGVVYLGGSTTSATLAVRNDASTSAPGSGAWIRNDGAGGIVFNPAGTGKLYFAFDNPAESHFGGAIIGTTASFSGQVQSNGVNVRRMTGGVSGSVTVPANGSVAWTVNLDDAITPTRVSAVAFGPLVGNSILNAQVTSIGSGTVSGVVVNSGASATVTVHVIAY